MHGHNGTGRNTELAYRGRAGVSHDRTGSEKLWAGTATIHPGAKTGAHHHGELQSVINALDTYQPATTSALYKYLTV